MSVDEPWGEFSRGRVNPGWRFPITKHELRTTLVGSGATVDRVAMGMPGKIGNASEPVLLSAYRVGDAQAGYFGLPGHGWTRLLIFAIPVERAVESAQVLTRDAVRGVSDWLARIPSRGNAWSASNHNHAAYLTRSGVRVDEH